MNSDYSITDDERIQYTLTHVSNILGEPCALQRGVDLWVVIDAGGNAVFSSSPTVERLRVEYGKWLAPQNGGIPY